MTKFISKNANLRIVLKHSIPPEPITGRLGVPGLYIKFENGIVNVNNEEHIKLMLAHNGFNRGDYIKVEEEQIDPYKNTRKESEPDHLITEFEHGRAENVKGSNHNVRLDPKLKDAAVEMAKEMAKEMAPQLAKDMLLEMAKQSKDRKAQEEDTKGTVILNDAKDEEFKKVDSSTITNATGSGEDKVEFKCVCGKIAKNKAGLAAHQRNCEVFKNEK